MRQPLFFLYIFICLTLAGHTQNYLPEDSLGKKWAQQELKVALTDTKQHNVIDANFIILNTKEKAIKFAEQVLFDIYGQTEIEDERPYKIYNVNDYWIISGTLPKDSYGGTFLIIISSHNCKVIRVTHGR